MTPICSILFQHHFFFNMSMFPPKKTVTFAVFHFNVQPMLKGTNFYLSFSMKGKETLQVRAFILCELPQGTLHFSIVIAVFIHFKSNWCLSMISNKRKFSTCVHCCKKSNKLLIKIDPLAFITPLNICFWLYVYFNCTAFVQFINH